MAGSSSLPIGVDEMEKILFTPLSEKDVVDLDLGEVVYLTGTIYTARDEAHLRALELHHEGKKTPVDFSSSAVFHCGPIAVKKGDAWEVVAAGPTTSTRMNNMEPEFIEKFHPRAIIGKGGMSAPTVEAMKKFGCVYLAITGGAAVLAAKGIKKVSGVEWYDLGMPEALWIFEAQKFGPLIVGIDAHGGSLFAQVDKEVEANLPRVKARLGL